jgi:hypothetical protein
MAKASVNKNQKNPIIDYKVKQTVEAIEYQKGQEARRKAWVTCKEEGCTNSRANGSSRCSDHKLNKNG